MSVCLELLLIDDFFHLKKFSIAVNITSFPASIKFVLRFFISPGKAAMEMSSLIKRPENFISLRIISINFLEVLAAEYGSMLQREHELTLLFQHHKKP